MNISVKGMVQYLCLDSFGLNDTDTLSNKLEAYLIQLHFFLFCHGSVGNIRSPFIASVSFWRGLQSDGFWTFISFYNKIQPLVNRHLPALAGVAQWIERGPANQRVLIPSQGTWLGCGPGPQYRVCERQPHIDISPLSFSFSSPFSVNE